MVIWFLQGKGCACVERSDRVAVVEFGAARATWSAVSQPVLGAAEVIIPGTRGVAGSGCSP